MPLTTAERSSALMHLRSKDRVLRKVIDTVGPFTLKIERNQFAMPVRSIISQQISTGAARSIRRRLEELVAPQDLTDVSIGRLSTDELRTAGVSPQKAGYLLDLAQYESVASWYCWRLIDLKRKSVAAREIDRAFTRSVL